MRALLGSVAFTWAATVPPLLLCVALCCAHQPCEISGMSLPPWSLLLGRKTRKRTVKISSPGVQEQVILTTHTSLLATSGGWDVEGSLQTRKGKAGGDCWFETGLM